MRVLHQFIIDGISILAYDECESQSAQWVAWELQEDDYHLREMSFAKGDIVVDIGAHIGLFSIYLAKRWPDITIYAFEPFPTNFRNCMDNLRLNHVENVVLSPMAVANDNRLMSMTVDPQNSGGASAVIRVFEPFGVVNDIKSVALDEVFSLRSIERCRLLKIDCEGMEYEILRGATVLNRVDYIAGEFHSSAYLQAQGLSPDRLREYCARVFAADRIAIRFNTI